MIHHQLKEAELINPREPTKAFYAKLLMKNEFLKDTGTLRRSRIGIRQTNYTFISHNLQFSIKIIINQNLRINNNA